MRHTVPRRIILFLSGLVVIGVGSAGLLAPEAFHEANGATVGADVSLLSEARAAGGALLAAGIVILIGAFVTRLARVAAAIGAVGYLAYSLSRLLGIAMDGLPSSALVTAMLAEFLIALACGFVLLRIRHDGTQAAEPAA